MKEGELLVVVGEEMLHEAGNLIKVWKRITLVNPSSFKGKIDNLIEGGITGVIYQVKNEKNLKDAERVFNELPLVALINSGVVVGSSTNCLVEEIDKKNLDITLISANLKLTREIERRNNLKIS